MRRQSLSVLACPSCQGPLEVVGLESQEATDNLVCRRETLEYPVIDGVPQLVRLDIADGLEKFALEYSQVWQRDGWGSSDPEYLLNLPTRDITRRRSGEWRVKAKSMAAVLEMARDFSLDRILDLGCGVGWLSYHLARGGHEVFAVDAVQNSVLGLRAAEVYLQRGMFFERVWGELERPPFVDRSFDAVICNASLHYASSIQAVVQQSARILSPAGIFLVMNSPVYRDRRSALRTEQEFRARLRRLGASATLESKYHHLVRDDLERVFSAEIGALHEAPYDPGLRFRAVRSLKGRFLGLELASFPVLWARKSSASV